MGRKRVGGGNDDRRIQLDDALVRSLFNEGKTAKEIAAVYGCSTHPVKVAMRRLGLSRAAAPRPGVNSGTKNASWRGGRRTRKDGYIELWTAAGVRLEHQVVAEQQILMRPLNSGEVVHHRDRNRSNNSPENLEVITQSDHIREHLPEMHAARYGR